MRLKREETQTKSMKPSGRSVWTAVLLFIFLSTMALAAARASAQTLTVLHSFTGGTDGKSPQAPVIADKSGNLFGTTEYGGTHKDGTVFELVYSPSKNSYTEKVLSSFNGSNGAAPEAGLISDAHGNLYGTTKSGGAYGGGTVFELVKSSGGYTEKVLHSFGSGSDGRQPLAGLLADSSGNLYGTTFYGGVYTPVSSGVQKTTYCDGGCGTVFELVNSSGSYTEKVLYSFDGEHGLHSVADLISDSSGNLYGTTTGGVFQEPEGGSGQINGTVFELVNSSGSYTMKVLSNYPADPWAGLVADASGNLYGTTTPDGFGNGSVFELVNTSGNYTLDVLHSFNGSDGNSPFGDLIADKAGNLYGTTELGGAIGAGTVFELVNSSGGYTEKVLHSFTGRTDGQAPLAGLFADASGNLYGTTLSGGGDGMGTVFGIAPVALSASKLDFGAVREGAESNSQTVTVTNVGSGSLTYGSASISGANASDFTISTDSCIGTKLGPGDTCSVSITFKPSIIGNETGSLSLTEHGLTQNISLDGTGALLTASLSPDSLSFSPQPVGATSTAQTVTLTNTSTSSLTLMINRITLSADFTQTGTTCGSSLAKDKSCTIDVAFTPTTTGTLTGTLAIADNASTGNGQQTVDLSGTSLTAQSYIQSIMVPQVESLGLNGGQTNSLVKELSDAIRMIGQGKINGAIGNLESFISEVNDLYNSGVLSRTEATTLIRDANSVIKSLG